MQVTWTAPNLVTLDGRLVQDYLVKLIDEDGSTVTAAPNLSPDSFR